MLRSYSLALHMDWLPCALPYCYSSGAIDMNLVIIKVYNDPGHGWGAVKRSLLKELDIEHKVSPYSYQRGRTVYLEEDCDLSLLCGTLQEKDIDIKFVEKYTDKRSPIRSYEHFQPELT